MLNHGSVKPLNCLIQVNVSGEQTKSGVSVQALIPLIDSLLKMELPAMNWRGLMTIGVNEDMDKTRTVFSTLRQCLYDCRAEFSLDDFDQLSMGMSDDYQVAIEEGATMIRLGTSIFGER